MEDAVNEWAVKNPKQIIHKPMSTIIMDDVAVNKTPESNMKIAIVLTLPKEKRLDSQPAIGAPIIPKLYAKYV